MDDKKQIELLGKHKSLEDYGETLGIVSRNEPPKETEIIEIDESVKPMVRSEENNSNIAIYKNETIINYNKPWREVIKRRISDG